MKTKGRKTVPVQALVDFANTYLADPIDSLEDRGRRLGIITMVERVLHDSNNYNGFCYLTKNDLPDGVAPGVNILNNESLPYEERFKGTDETRRKYF